jgi:1-acyl-sn-glycerol-3-phosphate acyltransferase
MQCCFSFLNFLFKLSSTLSEARSVMKSILYFINGTFSSIIYFVNTLLWFVPIMLCSLVKLLPIRPLQKLMSIIADECATLWIGVNKLNQSVFSRTHFNATLPTTLSTKQWYLVIANHQSWVDILVLQRVFNRKIPFLKFFLKQNLIFGGVLTFPL